MKARLQTFQHCHYDLNSGLNNSDEERSSTDGGHRYYSEAKVSLRGHIVFQFNENQAFFLDYLCSDQPLQCFELRLNSSSATGNSSSGCLACLSASPVLPFSR